MTIFLVLYRNNTFYAFILASFLILLGLMLRHKSVKKYLLYMLLTIILFRVSDQFLTQSIHAVPGFIKERMRIPRQEMARIYVYVDDSSIQQEITKYIPKPENYCYWLSDAIKQQLDSDDLDSLAKHFLLQTAIYNLKYPIICLDAIMYNTQGYWDIFHSPYQEIHSYLTSDNYRADISHRSYLPFLTQWFMKYFHKLEPLQDTL